MQGGIGKKIFGIVLAIFAFVPFGAGAFSIPLKQGAYTDFTEWYISENELTAVPYGAAVVLDYETLRPLYYHREQWVMPTASLMKLVTAGAIVKSGKVNWDERIGFSWWDNEGDLRPLVGPKDRFVLLRLNEGETIPVRDMFASMLILSANNSANRLASYIAGTVKNFIPLMQATAKEWGLENTTAVEPSGLSLGDTSDAKDLARAICMALREPDIQKYAGLSDYDLTPSLGRELKIKHTVHEVRNNPVKYFGAKTGFLYETNYHVAAGVITPKGRKLCAVVLNTPTRVDSESVLPAMALWADKMYHWPQDTGRTTSTPVLTAGE